MKVQQAFKFQLIPTREQQRKITRFAGACRWEFNEVLRLQIENYESGGKFVSYFKMSDWVVSWKRTPGKEWLADSPGRNVKAKS